MFVMVCIFELFCLVVEGRFIFGFGWVVFFKFLCFLLCEFFRYYIFIIVFFRCR